MEPLRIDGAWVTSRRVHRDDRGSFVEWFQGPEFGADLGYPLSVARVNCSVPWRGVVRGIHFADVPLGQAKYVLCVSGAILDVVVDLGTGSSYARWEAVRVDDDEDRRAVFLTEGLGHGSMTLTDQATVVYLARRRMPRAGSRNKQGKRPPSANPPSPIGLMPAAAQARWPSTL